MLRELRMVRWDLSLQLRHHIFTANVVSTAFLCGFALILPTRPLPANFASFLIFADPALIGMSFVGAMILMEKAMRVNLALGVTPSPSWAYLFSKTLTFTLWGTISGLAVAWATRGDSFDLPAMTGTLLVCNAVAVLIGFAVAARANSMNDLIIRLLYASTILYAPLLPHFGVVSGWPATLSMVVPSSSMLALIEGAIEPAPSATSVWLHVVYLALWGVVGWVWSLREYQASVVSEGR